MTHTLIIEYELGYHMDILVFFFFFFFIKNKKNNII